MDRAAGQGSAGGGAEATSPRSPTRIHKSAHPDLPPAQAQQVIQWLLAKNYLLTALELLVESQQAGRADEVADLQRFFSDTDKFPFEELSKHQNANALDVQAQVKEREERLQLVEYELRLAKEDLAEMHKKVEQATKQAAAATAAAAVAGASGVSPHTLGAVAPATAARTSSLLSPSSPHPPPETTAHSGGESSPATIDGHPSADGPRTRDGSSSGAVSTLPGGMAPACGPSSQDLQELNSAVLAHLLHQKLRMTALTLQEEAAALGGPAGDVLGGMAGPGAGDQVQVSGLELWRWMQVARKAMAAGDLCDASDNHSGAGAGLLAEAGTTQGGDDASETARLRHQLDDALQQLQQLQQQLQQQQQKLQQQGEAHAAPLAPPALATAAASSSALAAAAAVGSPRLFLTSGASGSSGMFSESSALDTGGPTPVQPIDPMLHERLQGLVGTLPDLLSRLIPNLTIKSRLELLSLVECLVMDVPCKPDQQATLVSLVLNLVPNPDEAQRRALVQSLERLGHHFGAPWVAVELLPLCIKQVSSSSSAERRTLGAQLLGALARLLELSTHTHVLLTQLHRLAEDRIEAVREAAVRSMATLVSQLQYSRQYYQVVEDMVLALACDPCEAVVGALRGTLLPALNAWAADTEADVLATSLVPRVAAEIERHVRQAVAASPGPQVRPQLSPPAGGQGHAQGAFPAPAIAFTGQSLSYSYTLPPQQQQQQQSPPGAYGAGSAPMCRLAAGTSMERRFPNEEYKVTYQLLSLYMALLPAVRHSALRGCPRHIFKAVTSARSPEAREATDQEAGAVGPVASDALDTPFKSEAGEGTGSQAGPRSSHAPPPHSRSVTSLSTPPPIDTPPHSQSQTHSRTGSWTAAGPAGGAVGFASVSTVDASREVGERAEALFGAWAGSKDNGQWKRLQWLVQLWLPKLLDICRLVPVTFETTDFRRQLALALHDTATTFGPAFTTAVAVPLVSAAAGACTIGQAPAPGGPLEVVPGTCLPVSEHIRASALDLVPQAPDAARLARERVLPQLLAAVLPAAGLLGKHLQATLGSTDSATGRWVLEALQDLQAAVSFVGVVHGQHYTLDILSVMENLAGSMSSTAAGSIGGVPPNPQQRAARGLTAVALANGLLPGLAAAANAEAGAAAAAGRRSFGGAAETGDVVAAGRSAGAGLALLKRRLVPLLMVLLSRGDANVQVACVWALLDVMLRFGDDSKLVEQVTVVFDGLLDGSSPEVTAAVLGCAGRLASVVAPSAARSAACAGQLEWVLQVVQRLSAQLQQPAAPSASTLPLASAGGAASPAGGRSPPRTVEQQRALAAQLVMLAYAVYLADVRLPRMQYLVTACIESLQRCRHLLNDQQASALNWMTKEKHGQALQSTTVLSDMMTRGAAAATAAGGPSGSASVGSAEGQASADASQTETSGMRARFEHFRKKLSRRGGSQDAAPDGPLQQQFSVTAQPPAPIGHAMPQGSGVPPRSPGVPPSPPPTGSGTDSVTLPPVMTAPASVSLQYRPAGTPPPNRQQLPTAKSSAASFFSDDES